MGANAMGRFSQDQWLGLVFFAIAILVIFVWVPLDVDTGIVDRVRRRLVIGDSLGPTVAGVVLLIGGLLCFVRPGDDPRILQTRNIGWIALLLIVFVLCIGIMRYAGPLSIGAEDYRALRATPPYSYIGYVLGGTAMVATLICVVQRKVTARAIAIGFASSVIIALLYDLPFDDLLLPPNGDV